MTQVLDLPPAVQEAIEAISIRRLFDLYRNCFRHTTRTRKALDDFTPEQKLLIDKMYEDGKLMPPEACAATWACLGCGQLLPIGVSHLCTSPGLDTVHCGNCGAWFTLGCDHQCGPA